uniref:Sushi domain-containing protein n=1 Tax=Xiphophorus couchianus TaxID=32473 RepID=A0A3B5MC35_9TELE
SYVIFGSSYRTCLEIGWYGKGDCVRKCFNSLFFNTVGQSIVDDKPGYQQTINFTCNTGYTMVGNETIRCTETAEYDYEPPQCIGKFCPQLVFMEGLALFLADFYFLLAYCPIPKGGENMVLTDESLLRKDFPEGTNVIYECGNGYEKESGSEIITCIGGNWTEPDLICKSESCLTCILKLLYPKLLVICQNVSC